MCLNPSLQGSVAPAAQTEFYYLESELKELPFLREVYYNELFKTHLGAPSRLSLYSV